jgi:hypothetical protein
MELISQTPILPAVHGKRPVKSGVNHSGTTLIGREHGFIRETCSLGTSVGALAGRDRCIGQADDRPSHAVSELAPTAGIRGHTGDVEIGTVPVLGGTPRANGLRPVRLRADLTDPGA